MNVSTIETTGLGDRSYLVTEGDVAVVIDPQRDIDRVLDLAREHRRSDHPRAGNPHPQRLRHRRTGTRPRHRSRIRRPRRRRRRLSATRHQATATSSTPAPSSYRPSIPPATPTTTSATCCTTRRARPSVCSPAGPCCTAPPDAPTCSAHEHTHDLTHAQFHSVRRLADELPDARAGLSHPRLRQLLLGHTGAAATPPPSPNNAPNNPALTQDEQSYVDELIAGLSAYPAVLRPHGRHQRAGTRAGRSVAARNRSTPSELRRRIEAGEWVVDLRNRTAFAAGHLDGTLAFELSTPSSPTSDGSTPGVPR